MSRLTNLIQQAKAKDAQLGADLEVEFDALKDRLPFGLNFERHVPEAVELPQRPVRKGDKVRILPPRGEIIKGDRRLWRVVRIDNSHDGRSLACLELLKTDTPEGQTVNLNDLVVVAEFRDAIYPGLRSTGKVERGGNRPYHIVINGENFHALELLTYTHRGRTDAIYIDPPYNTGARDWKYNNDYVEADDVYRHSKWLAMMERRLLLAKELLNPEESVLIVAIDEKEYARLGLLLEQVFPEAKIQMITSVINPGGASRNVEFTRVNEFIYFVMLGTCVPAKTDSDLLFTAHRRAKANRSPIWRGLLRGGAGPLREDSPTKFFPIFVDVETSRIIGAGEPLPLCVPKGTIPAPTGAIAIWPLKTDAIEGRWELSRPTFDERLAQGYVRVGGYSRALGQPSISYLRNAEIERLKSGELVSRGMTSQGHLNIDYAEDRVRLLYAKTVWNDPSHDAGTHGSSLLKKFVPNRSFPFPKSLYAVEDALRFFVKEKPNATILDFFAGSGTTAHAVIRLNRQDGGRRQCILVTNNEVSEEEARKLRQAMLRPGDPDWEKGGICEYITRPRIEAAITGLTPLGDPIEGSYTFTDEFPMSEGFEENTEFFTLTYLSSLLIRYNCQFSAIAPTLWLGAGAQGARIDEIPPQGWAVAQTYGVLENLDRAVEFARAVARSESIRVAYIITDDDRRFQMVCAELPGQVEPVRLYETYLTNCEMNTGRRLS